MRPTRDQWAMSLAYQTAQRSTCCRRSVGCVLLNERGHVIATGYNGVASGLPHCNDVELQLNPALVNGAGEIRDPEHWESEFIETYPAACSGALSASGTNLDGCQAIHAEQNALLQCKDVYSIHTCYVTTSPCVTCTKLLLNTSCCRIVFDEEYPHAQAKTMWGSSGRDWLKYSQLGPDYDAQISKYRLRP